MEASTEELLLQVEEKIKFGEDLIDKLSELVVIDGVTKLQRKIRQEIVFLKKLKLSKKVKKEQLSCSNLRHLGAMVDCTMRPGVSAVCKTFNSADGSKINIDIISDGGKVWTKVVARNPRSLSALSHGNASYGARSVVDQAQDYLECAQLYPCMYQTPQVIFEFASGIEDILASKLNEVGVIVKGELIPTDYEDYSSCNENDSWDSDDGSEEIQTNCISSYTSLPKQQVEAVELTTLNVDVTTMMAYVSNMTNGHCALIFKQPILTEQAAGEVKRPVKPILDELFEGKSLVCCDTAWEDFEKIVNIVGGEEEKARSYELKKRLSVLPDDTGGPDDPQRDTLSVRGRVRLRSKIVFNFGHRIRALTVSANEGFIRAANQQGLTYAAFIHESRALTEQKEAFATPILLP